MIIGEIIKSRRIELGMTQEELAHSLGYKSKSSINKIELGLHDIPLSKVKEFAKALKTTPAHLMGWDNDPKPFKPDYALFGKDDNIMAIYENLNGAGQERLRAYAEDLKASGRYKK